MAPLRHSLAPRGDERSGNANMNTSQHLRSSWAGGLTLAATLCVLPTAAGALTLNVNTKVDAVDAQPGNGVCATAGGKCALRAAIQEANAWPGTDTIKVPAGKYALTLAGKNETAGAKGDLNITDSVVVEGAGAVDTIIDGGVCADVEDPDCTSESVHPGDDRVLSVLALTRRVQAKLTGVTIQNGGGFDVYSGGIYLSQNSWLTLYRARVRENKARMFGGGIGNAGVLEVVESSVLRNTLPVDILGGQTATGGGILNFAGAKLTVLRSLIAENEAARGGGIANGGGTIEIRNSTISGNKATASGGGIRNAGTTRISFSTIALNEANRQIAVQGDEDRLGGGIYNYGELSPSGEASTVALGNSIVARNTDNQVASAKIGPDCYGKGQGKVTSFRGNVLGILTANCNLKDALLPGVNFDQTGTKSAPLDPKLAALAANGGPTRTHALQAGSPATDAAIGWLGATFYDCTATDQRRYVRPRDGDGDGIKRCDVGAFEANSVPSN